MLENIVDRAGPDNSKQADLAVDAIPEGREFFLIELDTFAIVARESRISCADVNADAF